MKKSTSKAGRTNKNTPSSSSSSSNFYVSKTTPQAHPQSYDVVRATVLTRTLTATTDDEHPPYISDDYDDYAEIESADQQNNAAHATQPVSSNRPRSADHARVGSEMFQNQMEITRPKTANPNTGRFR